ncbi:MAG: hypothetical protein WAS21_25835 [Geminicoccaceae bacterium]
MKFRSINSAAYLTLTISCLAATASMAPRPALAIAAPDARAVCLAAGGIDAGQSENALACNIAGVGDYRVVIGNAVSACTYVATLGNPGGGVPPAGQIGVARVPAANTLRVQTRNAAGVAANRSFHLVVAC